MKKMLRMAMVLAVVALAVVSVGSAFAAPPTAKHLAVKGTITAVTATTLTVGTTTFTVDASTKYHIAGTKAATLADFKVGDNVVVVASGTTALRVNLIP